MEHDGTPHTPHATAEPTVPAPLRTALLLLTRAAKLGALLVCVAVTIALALVGGLCSVVKLFDTTLFEYICTKLSELDWVLLTYGWEHVLGTKLVWTGDAIPARESAVLVCNHRTLLDWLVFLSLGARKGRIGQCMFFQKDVLKYVPGFGWGCYLLGHPFLKRRWTEDAGRIAATFARIRRRNLPIYLASFPEGSRFKPESVARSKRFCAASGKPDFTDVICPHTTGFAATVNALRDGIIDAVYDVTIKYSNECPLLRMLLCGTEVSVDVRRYDVRTLPRDTDGLGDWLLARWVEKDARLRQLAAGRPPAGTVRDEPYRWASSGLTYRVMRDAAARADATRGNATKDDTMKGNATRDDVTRDDTTRDDATRDDVTKSCTTPTDERKAHETSPSATPERPSCERRTKNGASPMTHCDTPQQTQTAVEHKAKAKQE